MSEKDLTVRYLGGRVTAPPGTGSSPPAWQPGAPPSPNNVCAAARSKGLLSCLPQIYGCEGRSGMALKDAL